jgi:hypothetical protein
MILYKRLRLSPAIIIIICLYMLSTLFLAVEFSQKIVQHDSMEWK